ncbi:PQQ-dependent sugar dehydrogenase [Candidatus Binatia bacterium]|nr:PQQ-dependent sugar dehydrogenase [Candidatus Binatia bacterium]
MRTYGKLTTIALTVLALALARPARAGTPIAGFDDTLVVDSLSSPTAIAFLPDGRLLVAEKSGALKLVTAGVASTLVNIPVCSTSEMGLLGIAVDPAFASNGFIYLYRTNPVNGCGSATGRFNEVVRVTMASNAIDIGSLSVLLTGMRTDNGNHDGGGLRIGPDGKLYVGVGDTGKGDNIGGPGSSTNPYAQDQNALEGKILRLNLDGTIPADNPFVGQVGKRAEIFAYGLRNPFRMGFDPLTGSLWVGDVGDLTVEEIDIVTSGDNYSWPYCEATQPSGCAQPGDVAPIFSYPHGGGSSLGSSITGGVFAGASFGGLENDYFFGDYTGSAIYHLEPNGSRNGVTGGATTFVSNAGGPVDFAFGPDGALYYVAILDGEVRRVAPLAAPSDVDAYLCYKAALARGEAPLPKGTQVALSDAVVPGPQSFDVKKAITLCNPASVNASSVIEPTAHQEGYQVKRVAGAPKFAKALESTSDQFASRTLLLSQESSLLVPSSAAAGSGGAPAYGLTTVDHYKCYKASLAKGSPKFIAPAPPTVSDDFFPGGQALTIKKPTRYCEPVAADGSPIGTPASKLVCYGVKLPSGIKLAKTTVSTSNPDFGSDVLVATAVSELCVPASIAP